MDVELNELTPLLPGAFFDSLRASYRPFDAWRRNKARDERHAWVYRHNGGQALSALCVYDIQDDEQLTDNGIVLPGRALKLCTFKGGSGVRGRKIGELFLKASFKFATANACEHIFIDVAENTHAELVALLRDFGFSREGEHNGDTFFLKKHPLATPRMHIDEADHFAYTQRYYPHFRSDLEIAKFIIPIRPQYHRILFPDYPSNAINAPEGHAEHVGNAIKLAYLSNSPTKRIRRGDVVLFYRTIDEKAITTIGVVERFESVASANTIARMVSRRTVYTENDIVQMAQAATNGVRVMLFRTIEHLPRPVPRDELLRMHVAGKINSTRMINDDTFSRILAAAGR